MAGAAGATDGVAHILWWGGLAVERSEGLVGR